MTTTLISHRIAAELRRTASALERLPDNSQVRRATVDSDGKAQVQVSWQTFDALFAGVRLPVERVNNHLHVSAKRDGIEWVACKEIGREETEMEFGAVDGAHAACGVTP